MKYEGPPRAKNFLVDANLDVRQADVETYSRLMGLSELYVDDYRAQSGSLTWTRSASLPEWSLPDATLSGNGMAPTAVKVGYPGGEAGLERFVDSCVQNDLAFLVY